MHRDPSEPLLPRGDSSSATPRQRSAQERPSSFSLLRSVPFVVAALCALLIVTAMVHSKRLSQHAASHSPTTSQQQQQQQPESQPLSDEHHQFRPQLDPVTGQMLAERHHHHRRHHDSKHHSAADRESEHARAARRRHAENGNGGHSEYDYNRDRSPGPSARFYPPHAPQQGRKDRVDFGQQQSQQQDEQQRPQQWQQEDQQQQRSQQPWNRRPDTRRDEDVMEEPHQRGVLRIYGHGGGSPGPDPKQAQDDSWTDGDRADPESSRDWDYAVTVDCGSSGSRIHIFKWLHRHAATSIPPFSPIFTKHAWTSSVKPGIDSFVDAPEKAIPHFRDLLDFAMSSLSEFRYKWHRTPIYVKATAGMRLIKNLPSRDRIMETIRDFLSDPLNSPFYFERSMARVISGEEEGVYGWLTANYLAGTLLHASSATSLGVLDMGGASVQITFRPPFDVLSNYFPLRMQQERIRLYTHSFLNFGANMALTRVHDRIISMGNESDSAAAGAAAEQSAGHAAGATWEGASTSSSSAPTAPPHDTHPSFYIGEIDGVRSFRHPCFPLGYSFTYEYTSSRDLRQSYTGLSSKPWQSDDEALGADMSPITTWSAENHKREMVHFAGSGDFGNCSAITWQLLHKKEACFDNTCSFDGIYQPRFGNVTFIATSNFVKFTHEELHLPANATLEDIDLKSRAICRMSWQALQDKYRYTSVEDLSTLCFKSRYVFTMLYKGFGFPYRGTRLIFARELMGLELDWALGSTLYEVQALPWDLDPGADNFRFRLGEDGSTEGGPPGSAPGSLEAEEEQAAEAEASRRDRSVSEDEEAAAARRGREEGWPAGDQGRGAPGDGSMDRVLQQPREQRRQAREAREAARIRQEQASRAPAPAPPATASPSHHGSSSSSSSDSKSRDHAASTQPSEEARAASEHRAEAAAPRAPPTNAATHHTDGSAPAAPPRSSSAAPASHSHSSSPPSISDHHGGHGWSPLMYSLFGGMLVGWVVTLMAFWACMSQARATIRKLEDRADRYETIRERVV